MIKFFVGLAIGLICGGIIGFAIGLGSTPEPPKETFTSDEWNDVWEDDYDPE